MTIATLPSRAVGRIAFLGTPELAAGVLSALVLSDVDVAVVVTRQDKRRGRGAALVPSPVKSVAESLGVPVVHTLNELLEEHVRRPIELGVVVAFGEIVPPRVLAEIPMVNLHVSLLPRWRGAAPIERAILAGDELTGVCLMQLEEGLDTGGVIATSTMAIEESTTAADIGRHLMSEGTELLLQALRSGDFSVVPQSGTATYAAKIDASERHIDWSEPADMVSRRVRIGGAWTTFRGRRLKIHEAVLDERIDEMVPGRIVVRDGQPIVGCGVGAIRLVGVQPEGRPRIAAQEWARGARIAPDESMSNESLSNESMNHD